jgi:hypothetical protein
MSLTAYLVSTSVALHSTLAVEFFCRAQQQLIAITVGVGREPKQQRFGGALF